MPNIFFSGAAKLIVEDGDDIQYIERDPVGGDSELGSFGIWSPLVTYAKNNIVEGSDGEFYQSFSNGNLNNNPVSTPTAWFEIRFIGVWNTNKSYSIGDVVQTIDGNLWKSVVDTNSGNTPSISDKANWLPAISDIIPRVVNYISSGILSTVVPNRLTGSVAVFCPLAASVEDGTFVDVEKPEFLRATTSSVFASSPDVLRYSGGTTVFIELDIDSSETIRLTSNGVDEWSF